MTNESPKPENRSAEFAAGLQVVATDFASNPASFKDHATKFTETYQGMSLNVAVTVSHKFPADILNENPADSMSLKGTFIGIHYARSTEDGQVLFEGTAQLTDVKGQAMPCRVMIRPTGEALLSPDYYEAKPEARRFHAGLRAQAKKLYDMKQSSPTK